ncbi:MAG: acyl carrier protein, partial [Hyphomicrobiales bacterium]
MHDDQMKAGIEIIASVLGCQSQDVKPDATIGFHPQWDSITHVTIIMAFEEKLGRQLSTEEIASLIDVQSF